MLIEVKYYQVWRCLIIYRNCRFPFIVVMAIPCLTYISSFSMYFTHIFHKVDDILINIPPFSYGSLMVDSNISSSIFTMADHFGQFHSSILLVVTGIESEHDVGHRR